jgi:hypothetical protein
MPDDANTLTRNLAHSPVGLRDVPDPQPLHDDWVVTRPRLTGICGSESKQILLDFGEGDTDNAMAAFCSFPQVMGHEVVADVVALAHEPRLAVIEDLVAWGGGRLRQPLQGLPMARWGPTRLASKRFRGSASTRSRTTSTSPPTGE